MTTTDDLGSPVETSEQPPPTPPTPPAPQPALQAKIANKPKSIDDANAKSPILAMLLAFVPFGLGHLYLGLYNRALLFFGAFWFSMYLEAFIIGAFFYFFAIIDAYRHAQLINSAGTEGEEPIQVGKGALNLGVFLVVVGVSICSAILGAWQPIAGLVGFIVILPIALFRFCYLTLKQAFIVTGIFALWLAGYELLWGKLK